MKSLRRKSWVVGITGASGSIYGVRLTESLLSLGYDVQLIVSNAGWRVLKEEMGFQTGNREEVLAEKFGGYEDVSSTIRSPTLEQR